MAHVKKGNFGKREFLTDTKLTYQKDPQCLDAVNLLRVFLRICFRKPVWQEISHAFQLDTSFNSTSNFLAGDCFSCLGPRENFGSPRVLSATKNFEPYDLDLLPQMLLQHGDLHMVEP